MGLISSAKGIQCEGKNSFAIASDSFSWSLQRPGACPVKHTELHVCSYLFCFCESAFMFDVICNGLIWMMMFMFAVSYNVVRCRRPFLLFFHNAF